MILERLLSVEEEYQSTLTETAEECSNLVKQLTEALTKMDFPSVAIHWREDNDFEDEYNRFIDLGLYYCPKKKKILYWVDDTDNADFVLGSSRNIRASLLPKVIELSEQAVEMRVEEINKLKQAKETIELDELFC